MIRLITSTVLAALATSALAQSSDSDNLTQRNVEKTLSIIEAAVAAHGADALADLRTITVHYQDTDIAAGQSLKPEPPWDRRTRTGMAVYSLESQQFFARSWGAGGGFEYDNGNVFNGENSYGLNWRAGTAQPLEDVNFEQRTGPFVRVTPALLVRRLQARQQNAHFLGEATIGDTDFNVIAFSMTVGPAISLYFDKVSHVLRRSERFLPGFGLVEYRFDDYTEVEGVPFPQSFELYVAGEENIKRRIHRIQVNQPIEPYLSIDEDLRLTEALPPDPLTRQELAEGVYHIGGQGTYALFVEMEDHVVAIGGTGGLPQRIASLREVVPDKPLRFGVLTHHHADHVLGVATYEAEGATVIASQAHESAVRDAAEDGAALAFEGVTGKRTMGKGDRRVELFDIGPTAHTEHLIVAWLPAHGILFEADHFAMPRSGPVPPAVTGTRDFAAALKRLKLKPQRIMSAHSPKAGTMTDLQKALDTPTANASGDGAR